MSSIFHLRSSGAECESVVSPSASRTVEQSSAARLVISIDVSPGAPGFEVVVVSNTRGRAGLGSAILAGAAVGGISYTEYVRNVLVQEIMEAYLDSRRG